MNRLEFGALVKGPVMSRDSSIHGVSGGGIAPVGTASWGLGVATDHICHGEKVCDPVQFYATP